MIQTATNIEQSRKLLSLGIDPETADMSHCCDLSKPYKCAIAYKDLIPHIKTKAVPAWSLSALLDSVIPKLIPDGAGEFSYALKIQPNSYPGWTICYYAYSLDKGKFYNSNPNIFAACIDLIGRLVEQGYIKTKKV